MVLIECLNNDLSAGLSPAIISVRAGETGGSMAAQDAPLPPPQHVVVFGASHMKRTIPFLVSKGLRVTDLTASCWMASAKNNSELVKTLSGVSSTADTFFVLDLFGNSTTRYRTPDDTTSPATNRGRGVGWHMLGDVTWATDRELGEQVDSLKGVFSVLKEQNKIVLPPIPRYAFGGCCANPEHAGNTLNEEHAAMTLTEHTSMRNFIKHRLVSTNTKNIRILDILGSFAPTHITTEDKIPTFKNISHTDNTHLTTAGYAKLADAITSTIDTVRTVHNTNKPNTNTNSPHNTTWLWKGFGTAAGTGATATLAGNNTGRGGNRRHHPYRR